MHTRTQGRSARLFRISVATALAAVVLATAVTPANSAAVTSMRFGFDIESLSQARSHKVPVSFGTFWLGSWTGKYGWGYAESQLRAAKQARVTPVINWWYWGDDISPQCVDRGCHDARQNVHKDRATWNRMADELSRLIERTMGSREAIVVLETEFNKGGIENYEPFDGYLAEQVRIFHRRGNIKVVVAFGNWGHGQWERFDRAAAAADYVGTQLLQSSVQDASTYARTVDTLLSGARAAQRFGKPTLIVDLALSSYPSASYEAHQAAVTRELFARMPELKAAGVRGILYRMMADDPKFDTSNYHGVAERHWGFLRADGSAKPAFAAFAAGVRQESHAD
jgi:hypothetical protein